MVSVFLHQIHRKSQRMVATIGPSTWGFLGFWILIVGFFIGWILYPYLLNFAINDKLNLAAEKDFRKIWAQSLMFDFKVYLFNITNSAAVMRGAKPIVQEIGPYCYRERKDKDIFKEDDYSDTITYKHWNTWFEHQKDPRCPAPELTGEEIFVIPNVPLLSILMVSGKDFPAPFLALVNLALPRIFGRFDDVFLRTTARRLLFDGVLIDCSSPTLLSSSVCDAIRENSGALKKLGGGLYSFSFFGGRNGTKEESQYTIKKGTSNSEELGQLVAIDNKTELTYWRGKCNKLQGTDGSVFPPFRQMENRSLTAYSTEVCRVLFGVFEGQRSYDSITGYAYSINFGNTEENFEDRCFCPTDDRCYKKGVLDAYKCLGAPLAVSLPHFYQASTDYIEGVEGLQPNRDKHGVLVVLEPISGAPLLVRKRIQMSIQLRPISYTSITQRLKDTLVPLFWAEELMELDKEVMSTLEASLFRPMKILDTFKWMCILIGIGLIVIAIILKIKYRRNNINIESKEENIFDQESIFKDRSLKYLQHAGDDHKTWVQGLSTIDLMKTASTMTVLPFVKE